jgi:hypothetical protein
MHMMHVMHAWMAARACVPLHGAAAAAAAARAARHAPPPCARRAAPAVISDAYVDWCCEHRRYSQSVPLTPPHLPEAVLRTPPTTHARRWPSC